MTESEWEEASASDLMAEDKCPTWWLPSNPVLGRCLPQILSEEESKWGLEFEQLELSWVESWILFNPYLLEVNFGFYCPLPSTLLAPAISHLPTILYNLSKTSLAVLPITTVHIDIKLLKSDVFQVEFLLSSRIFLCQTRTKNLKLLSVSIWPS